VRSAPLGIVFPAALAAACLSAGVFFALRGALRPAPSLERVGPLARAGHFDQALACVEAYLRVCPSDPRARLAAAELALDRPDPRPDLALDHLGRIATGDRRLSAAARLDEGKATYLLELYDRAESCWLRALDLDPQVPEAAWALLDLYYLEGRPDDARRLALRQYAIEPDRHDRVKMLLELIRQDVEPPAPASVVNRFEPAVRRHPGQFHAAIALGLALVRSGRPDPGIAVLREVVRGRPDDPVALDALLTGLDDADRPEELASEVGRLSPALADDPRLARHLGRAAQARLDWAAAARAYHRASEYRPHDLDTLFRLDLASRTAGIAPGDQGRDGLKRSAQAARTAEPGLYAEANGKKDLGNVPDPGLYRRLAVNRERLGRRDEARAWHLLIIRDFPNDPTSGAEADRLK
jgi:tetratricopeptide (TPR) repeat protein